MIDLDLDDSLDLDVDDDLLALDVPQVKRVEPFLPAQAVMLQRCREFAKEVAQGRAADVYYDGVTPDLALATYAELFSDWWGRYQRKANPMLLELAFMCVVKNLAGASWNQVYCKLLNRELRAEVVDCTTTAVRLLVDRPFEASSVKSNVQWLPRWQLVWFNRQTRKPLNPTEPFRLL